MKLFMATHHLCLTLYSISLINVVLFCGLFINYERGDVSNVQWIEKVAKEVGEVESISCSGHGKAFLDGFVDRDGKPVCECYACFAGPDCSLSTHPCVADADRYMYSSSSKLVLLKSVLINPLVLHICLCHKFFSSTLFVLSHSPNPSSVFFFYGQNLHYLKTEVQTIESIQTNDENKKSIKMRLTSFYKN